MDETIRVDGVLPVPPACTLPTAQRPTRVAEFYALFGTAVEEVVRAEPLRLRLMLRPDPAVAARVADLFVRETSCCSFFTFMLTSTGGSLWLDVTAPAAYVAVLDGLAAWAAGPGVLA